MPIPKNKSLDFGPIRFRMSRVLNLSITTATEKKAKYYLMPVRVTVATLTCSNQPEAAREFAEFVASERASNVFEEFGFTTAPTRINYRDGKKVD